ASEGLRADRIWFMEMNTRLQVEHPVTEMITGQDLVEWQLRVASGEPLPKEQDELSINGWAMEARLYAENPATGFLPSTGKLDVLALPDTIRLETGVSTGDSVTPFYDPMIAKLVAFGANRDAARISLAQACDGVATWPVHNNAGFLSRLLRHENFADFNVTTGFIDANLDALVTPPEACKATLSYAALELVELAKPASISPWTELTGFRAGSAPDLDTQLLLDGEIVSTSLTKQKVSDCTYVYPLGNGAILVQQGWPFHVQPRRHDVLGDAALATGAITSPMPGRVVSVSVAPGDKVTKGQKLVTLEAMKMEHAMAAPFDGVVAELSAVAGGQVSEGVVLARLEPAAG
ncbi:MAG: biotin/lipoyl-binding protein, partial [Caulobacter sp.]|nr:biotin/lipoyl-binding protein [Caulobacter sp.]